MGSTCFRLILIRGLPRPRASTSRSSERSHEANQRSYRRPGRPVEGWLDLIARATGRQLTVEQVKDCTYQSVHRAASVCSVQAERRAVVDHGFDLNESQRRYYLAQLTLLAGLVATPDKLRLFLLTNKMAKSPAYSDLQAKWRANEGRDFAQDIRRLLRQHNVAAFNDPVVTTIP